ncbi:MAG: hypothetical protein WEA80_03480 [Gemmatimonadaceae bacterium]
MAKPGRSHDALQQLLEERKRYEQWLATLESRRDSTPGHVYERVHADYEQRLAAVRDQLTERTSEIRSAVAALKDRLKQATEEETARVDELHEAELRAVVGEFTPEQWELRKREVEVELKRFVDEKRKISDELNQLLLIVEQTSEEEAPSRAAAEPPPIPPGPAPVPADATSVSRKTPARSRAATPAMARPAVEQETPTVPIESLAPADGLPAKVPESTRAPAEPAPAETAPAPAKSETRANSHGKRGKTSTFVPAQPDPRRENEKTLKCAECGAMNYPTEWYCESCGGELAAL